MQSRFRLLLISLLLIWLLVPWHVEAEDIQLRLRIMATSDIHVHLLPYDYYQDKPQPSYGLAQTATLIRQARSQAVNTLLFDNGDLLQGNPLGDYLAHVQKTSPQTIHPAIKALNALHYDAFNLGNHEFNYGLPFLQHCLQAAHFPCLNANVYYDDHDSNSVNDRHYFTPYVILKRTFQDTQGHKHTLHIGVLGLVTPYIMQWDYQNLHGRVIAKDLIATARQLVPQIRAQGAELIIVLDHSGIDIDPQQHVLRDHVSKVPGIDAIIAGHDHKVFPGPLFTNIPGIDNTKGTIHGVPTVMPGYWGSHLGIIDLTLAYRQQHWCVQAFQVKNQPIGKRQGRQFTALVKPDPAIVKLITPAHQATLRYIRAPIGRLQAPIQSYFSLVQDDPAIQLVSNAQKWYAQRQLQNTPYAHLPLISAAAPFKAGGRGGPSYYVDIPAGTIAIKNVADLYVYPNTLKALLLNGREVREWLEMSAGLFNQINPHQTAPQNLIKPDFPTYNFDVLDGLTYRIDLTQPARYDRDGQVQHPQAHRIKKLCYQGQPVKPQQRFIVVTNNYRAYGGGHFPNLDSSKVILDAPDKTQQIIIDYIRAHKIINPAVDHNWSFVPLKSSVQIFFHSSPTARRYLNAQSRIHFVSLQPDGFAKYRLDLSPVKQKTATTH